MDDLFDKTFHFATISNYINKIEELGTGFVEDSVNILSLMVESRPTKEAYVCGLLVNVLTGHSNLNCLNELDDCQMKYAYFAISGVYDCVTLVI